MWATILEIGIWLLSSSVVGIVTWAGSVLTVVGLTFTFLQARSAKSAAQNAEAAVSKLRVQLDTANIAYTSAELNTFLHIVRSGDYSLGQAFFGPLKRSIRLQCQSHPERFQSMEALNRSIGAIDNHLEWGMSGNAKFQPARIHRAVNGILETVTHWEGELSKTSRHGG